MPQPTTLEEQLRHFRRDGYVILPGLLSESEVVRLRQIVEDNTQRLLRRSGAEPDDRALVLDFLSLDEDLVEFVDDPRILPLVTSILGTNIYLYHTHWCFAPPLLSRTFPRRQHFIHAFNEATSTTRSISGPGDYWRWHRDGGWINDEAGADPQPLLTLKVAVYLTDLSHPGGANTAIIPGSHTTDLDPSTFSGEPPESEQVLARPGDVMVFDRRLVHSSSPNLSERTRMVLFYGYGYRWLRPRDDMTVARYLEAASPVRRQLLGASSSGYAYSSPTSGDLPLAAWLAEHGDAPTSATPTT
jgi:hypothetical protein